MDAEGFEPWYRSEHPRLVSAMSIAAGDPAVGAEVADEAFARAYERWNRVRTMEAPMGWTYRTAVNVLRRRQRRAAVEERLLRRVGEPSPRPIDWSAEMWETLLDLPVRERTAIALRYVADLSTEQIADAMGVAPGTVGSTLHNARARLAVLLGDDLPLEHAERPTPSRLGVTDA